MQDPGSPKGEVAAAILKGAVSAIPFVGGVVSEVGNLYLNPLEKRKQRWLAEVSSAINEINERFSLLPQELEGNEQFISFLYQATIIALKNHQVAKLNALRNALVSAAKPDAVEEDVSFQFLRYVDDLSPSHLRMLISLQEHIAQFSGCTKLEEVYGRLPGLASLQLDRTHFRIIVQDLDARFLIRLGDVEDFAEYASKVSHLVTEDSAVRPLTITSLGTAFVDFIRAGLRPNA